MSKDHEKEADFIEENAIGRRIGEALYFHHTTVEALLKAYADEVNKERLDIIDDKYLIKHLFNYKFESNNAGKKRQRLRMEGAKILIIHLKQLEK